MISGPYDRQMRFCRSEWIIQMVTVHVVPNGKHSDGKVCILI